jgi:hyaluronoglucosaminidase
MRRPRPRPLALLLILAAAVVAPARAARLELRGVVEGYYGRPWTGEARRDVIRFLGAHGLDTFVYAPKNDAFHRERWREPYPPEALADLRATAAAARAAGVRFLWAVSPVLDVCYSCSRDRRLLRAKLAQLARQGIRDFALLYDDGGAVTDPADLRRYGGSSAEALARAQADLSNHVRRWLRGRRLRLLLVVPTEYAGTVCLPYHATLARRLARGVPLGWTGSGVFAATVTAAEAQARAACLPGHPVVLWDNFPVNDTVLANNLHLGPLTGREPALVGALGGYLLNPMTQAHASLVALGTAAAYLRDPLGYDPEVAWAAVLAELGAGGDGLAVLAAQLRSSPLDLTDARWLAALLDTLDGAWRTPAWAPALDALDAEIDRQAAAPGDLAARLGGTPLGAEIAPWVAELAAHAARARDAMALLRALRPTLDGTPPAPGDATVAAALGPGFAAEGAAVAARRTSPPLGGYLACLGDLLSADIRLCTDFGLNVHGKAFLFYPRTPSDLVLVTDRNVHDRLVLFAAAAFAEWTAAQGG